MMNIKHLTVAVGSLLLLSSTALAQGLSAYKDKNNTVWITGLQPSRDYTIQNVLTDEKTSAITATTNTCGVARIPQSQKYIKLSVNGTTFNVSSLPVKPHSRCNSSSRNRSR
jgi:hypothetical protein